MMDPRSIALVVEVVPATRHDLNRYRNRVFGSLHPPIAARKVTVPAPAGGDMQDAEMQCLTGERTAIEGRNAMAAGNSIARFSLTPASPALLVPLFVLVLLFPALLPTASYACACDDASMVEAMNMQIADRAKKLEQIRKSGKPPQSPSSNPWVLRREIEEILVARETILRGIAECRKQCLMPTTQTSTTRTAPTPGSQPTVGVRGPRKCAARRRSPAWPYPAQPRSFPARSDAGGRRQRNRCEFPRPKTRPMSARPSTMPKWRKYTTP